jgi:spermidine/putrescine ABC transporter ATP-binding subunit
MSTLSLKLVNKHFKTLHAVKDVTFDVIEGHFVSLLGPSGCGKTTTLRMIAGLEEVSSGTIHLAGKDVTYDPPYKRNMGMVFQNYALFPHMTVRKNIEFGLKMRKVDKQEIPGRVAEALSLIQLEGHEERYPKQLSGGQQQRIALARVLALQPGILLFDEPLSNLDARLREEMRITIKKIQNQVGITSVFVTHDQEEALTLSDYIFVMNNGEIIETGTPQEIYSNPGSLFTASFIGNSNIIKGQVIDIEDNIITVKAGEDFSIRCRCHVDSNIAQGHEVSVLIRQELMRLSTDTPRDDGTINRVGAKLKLVTFLGPSIEYICNMGNQEVRLRRPNEGRLPDVQLEQDIQIEWDINDGVVLRR